VLSKADLAPDVDAAVANAESVAPGVAIHATSAVDGAGLSALEPHLRPGRTAVALGPSGAGKSTLVNALLGRDALATGAIRDSDGRGRHTTSHRELLILPSGALLIDTPGLRALGLVDAGEGLSAVFEDVEGFASDCRFPDCSHETEPACAVRAALREGSLDRGRFEGYRKLQREEAHAQRERDPRARLAERKKWKQISASIGRRMDAKYGTEWR
jgi:ribosome biogenesis GTPase